MVEITVIIVAIVSVILLFISMVLSAMAAMDAKKSAEDCKEGCHKYSMWSALVTGLSVALIVVVMAIYIYTSEKKVREEVNKHIAALHGYAVSKLSSGESSE